MQPTNALEDQIEPAIEHPAPRRQTTLHLAAALAGALAVGAVGGVEFIAKPALEAAEKAQKETTEVTKIAELAKSSLEQAIQQRDEALTQSDKAVTVAEKCTSINKGLHETICKTLADGHPEIVQQTMCKPEEPEEQPQSTKNKSRVSL